MDLPNSCEIGRWRSAPPNSSIESPKCVGDFFDIFQGDAESPPHIWDLKCAALIDSHFRVD